MSARSGARWVRVALAIAAAVVAALVFVVLMVDDGATERRSLESDVAEVAPRAEADVVLASSDAPEVAELAATAPSEEPRRAAAVGEAGALRWSDVLQPVDALSGVALTDVRVAHAPESVRLMGEKAEPSWGALDQFLATSDFAAPGFVAIDSPGHVPAIVDLRRALGAEERPVLVALVPSASLRIDVLVDGAGVSMESLQRLLVLRSDSSEVDPSPLELDFGSDVELHAIGRHDSVLGQLTVDGDAYFEIACGYSAERSLTAMGVHLHHDLNFRPKPAADQFATWHPALVYALSEDIGTSTTIHGLPSGVEFELRISRSTPIAIEPAHPDTPFGDLPAPIVLEPGELRVITLRLLGSADVIGALPGGATDGVVELMWRSADGTWVGCESRRELSGGEFRFDDVRPGVWQAAITWRDSSGAHVRVARAFEVVAGETYDLGVLAPNDGVDVTIVPRVEIDGVVDETLLGGALRETSWRFDHSGFEATASELDSATAKVLEPLVLRGILGDEFFIAFDRPHLPRAAAASLRFVEWRCATRHTLDGPLTIEATLCLATSLRVPLEFVAPGASRSSYLRVSALARRVDGDREDVRTIDVPTAFVLDPSRELRGASASLDPGTWEIFASLGTQTPFENGDEAVSWFGSTRVVVVPGATARIELAPAATVVFGPNFDWRGAEPSGWFQVVPADAPDALAPLAYPWPGDGITHDAAVDGLSPDTEYRVLGSAVRFRTGASGSRTVLE